MTSRPFGDDVIFTQRLLRSAGLYSEKIDGIWGPKTEAGLARFNEIFEQTAKRLGRFDAASESRIRTLQPLAQTLARRTLKIIRDAGINARIISASRSYAEQDRLFRQGRSGSKGPIVTNARGGQSNHNFGIAWDIGIFTGTGKYLSNSPLYADAGRKVMSAHIPRLEWGGNWITFKDTPHYQVATGISISEVKRRFESGKAIVQEKPEEENNVSDKSSE
jgi:peptidoglycan L-alanyl-D-glutamate endopeptidase CwlK